MVLKLLYTMYIYDEMSLLKYSLSQAVPCLPHTIRVENELSDSY